MTYTCYVHDFPEALHRVDVTATRWPASSGIRCSFLKRCPEEQMVDLWKSVSSTPSTTLNWQNVRTQHISIFCGFHASRCNPPATSLSDKSLLTSSNFYFQSIVLKRSAAPFADLSSNRVAAFWTLPLFRKVTIRQPYSNWLVRINYGLACIGPEHWDVLHFATGVAARSNSYHAVTLKTLGGARQQSSGFVWSTKLKSNCHHFGLKICLRSLSIAELHSKRQIAVYPHSATNVNNK